MEHKKPGLAVMIALGAKDKMRGDMEEPSRDEDSAQEILDAIDAKDASKLGELLHAFVMSCLDEQESEPQDEEEEPRGPGWKKLNR
jgi:CRISPR/Cas system Type II protein with McrA/HNH and RuvC-like nuclease domain